MFIGAVRPGTTVAQPTLSVYDPDSEPTTLSGAVLGRDPIVGSHHPSAIGTLVERQTPYS